MKLIRKFWKEALIIFSIFFLYFILRLPNLTLQPIFADEAIYIRWAQVMKAEPTLRFLPQSDGKTPLFMWVLIPLFKVFSDPLFAGRILSIFSGFGTLLGVLFLGWRFFEKRVGIWSAFLVAVTPYLVFFDRLALVDSMLAMFSIWSLILCLLLIKFPRLDLAMILGYFFGAGLLTKPPGFLNLLALPSTLLLFDWKDKFRQQKFLKIFAFWIVAIVITLGIYNILRLGPGFDSLNSRNQDYVFSPIELKGRPLDPFIPHMRDIQDWFSKLLTIPISFLVIFGAILAIVKRDKVALVVLIWLMVPLIIQMVFLKVFTARYILFSIPPLLVLAATALMQIKDWLVKFLTQNLQGKYSITIALDLLLISLLIPAAMIFNIHILTNLSIANLPKNERIGYLEDWTAGYGLKDIAKFLDEESKKGSVVVGTEGSFGTLPDGLQIYLDKNRQVTIIGGKATVSAQLRNAAKDHPTYFVANRSRYSFYAENLELIREYLKIKGQKNTQDSILLFRVIPE